MERYEESLIKGTELVGKSINSVVDQINHYIDLIMDENSTNNIDYDFFDIKGLFLFHGIPGTGKTSASHNIMKYALDKYGLESYYINTSDIIVSGLGESVKNLCDELEAFSSKDQGIIFLDEIDKLCINRNNNDEVSELKRMLIELMQFFDSICFKSKKIIIACTNVYDQLDKALLRRFSLQYEFEQPSFDEKLEFIKVCTKKLGLQSNIKVKNKTKIEKYQTIDEIKSEFRKAILSDNITNLINSYKEDK